MPLGRILTCKTPEQQQVSVRVSCEKRDKGVKELDLDRDNHPDDRILGLLWCLETNTFKFKMAVQERQSTRRVPCPLGAQCISTLVFSYFTCQVDAVKPL